MTGLLLLIKAWKHTKPHINKYLGKKKIKKTTDKVIWSKTLYTIFHSNSYIANSLIQIWFLLTFILFNDVKQKGITGYINSHIIINAINPKSKY